MKLLIVEDEHHVRDRIAEGIDWAAHHIELTAAVSSGKEAISILLKDHIDIVLTDIYMPEMSGLELAKWIKSEYPSIKTLILTGYDDFEYAREGIEYGVYRYLVKPAENELILESVLEAACIRETELLEKHNIQVLEQRWKQHLPHLQETFYKNWLNGRYSLWEIEKRSRDLQLILEDKTYIPVVLDMDPIAEDNGRFEVHDRPLVQFLLLNIARDTLNDLDWVVLQDDDGMTDVLFMARTHETSDVLYARVNQKMNSLLNTVKDILKLSASAGIGPIVTDRAHLAQAFKQSRMALQERMILGNGIAIPYRAAAHVEQSWLFMDNLEKELELAIEFGDAGKCQQLIQSVMESGFSNAKPVAEAKETLWRMACLLARMVHTRGWTLRETLKEDYEEFEHFNKLLAREQIEKWQLKMALRISRTITERRQSGTQIAMSEIVRFIHERLHDEELSLYLVAEKMFISYSYLSRTFKEAAGESFSEYVLRLRMERAKELLTKGYKVYDAAEQVGYRHVNYFSKSFQKYWGVKPSEIR
jgi:two-component system response regulator YesN